MGVWKCRDHFLRKCVAEELGDIDMGQFGSGGEYDEIDEERVVEPLIALLDQNLLLRSRAASELGHLCRPSRKNGGERAVEPLIALLLDDDDVGVRSEAAFALGEMGDERAVEPLISLLGDEDFAITENAADALGRIGGERAVEPLIAYLGRVGGGIAIELLGKIGDERAVEPLIALLLDGDDSDVRSDAAIALGRIGDERAVEPLSASARNDDHESVRKVAEQALGRIGDRMEEVEGHLMKSGGRVSFVGDEDEGEAESS